MAFTYTWQNIVDEVSRLCKRPPVSTNWKFYCDMVSSAMYTRYPWKDSLQNIASGFIPLVDGQQDYSVPTNIYRLTKASIVRTDCSPAQHRELNVQSDLDVDLLPRSYMAIAAASLQAGVGLIRLDSAISVPTGYTLELQGEYQINSPKVNSLSEGMWFQDAYQHVAFAGVLYYGYKLADDPRAGSAATNGKGVVTYTGQLGEFQSALDRMEQAEDYGPSEVYYPSESMGADRLAGQSIPRIFGGS